MYFGSRLVVGKSQVRDAFIAAVKKCTNEKIINQLLKHPDLDPPVNSHKERMLSQAKEAQYHKRRSMKIEKWNESPNHFSMNVSKVRGHTAYDRKSESIRKLSEVA